MLATSSQARLWLVALGVEQSPLAGLSLVIGQEHPELRCCLLDLDPTGDDATGVVDELLSDSAEARITWRGRIRHVARIVSSPLAIPEHAPALRGDRTYLITGGVGTLGLLGAKSRVQL